MPENALGHSDPIFYNLQYLPKRLVSDYIWDFLNLDRYQCKKQVFIYLEPVLYFYLTGILLVVFLAVALSLFFYYTL